MKKKTQTPAALSFRYVLLSRDGAYLGAGFVGSVERALEVAEDRLDEGKRMHGTVRVLRTSSDRIEVTAKLNRKTQTRIIARAR